MIRIAATIVGLAALLLIAPGCEFDFEDDVCEGDQVCSWSCGEGLCNWECSDDSECSADCQGGGCNLDCEDDADCQFDCTGGDCTLRCYDDAQGQLWCPPDVECSLQNFDNANCEQIN